MTKSHDVEIYTVHFPECAVALTARLGGPIPTECTCGLEKALKQCRKILSERNHYQGRLKEAIALLELRGVPERVLELLEDKPVIR